MIRVLAILLGLNFTKANISTNCFYLHWLSSFVFFIFAFCCCCCWGLLRCCFYCVYRSLTVYTGGKHWALRNNHILTRYSEQMQTQSINLCRCSLSLCSGLFPIYSHHIHNICYATSNYDDTYIVFFLCKYYVMEKCFSVWILYWKLVIVKTWQVFFLCIAFSLSLPLSHLCCLFPASPSNHLRHVPVCNAYAHTLKPANSQVDESMMGYSFTG